MPQDINGIRRNQIRTEAEIETSCKGIHCHGDTTGEHSLVVQPQDRGDSGAEPRMAGLHRQERNSDPGQSMGPRRA